MEYCKYCRSYDYEYKIKTLCCDHDVCNECMVKFMLTSTVPMCRVCQDIWDDNDMNIQLSTEDYLKVIEHKNTAALNTDKYYRQLWNTFIRIYRDNILTDLIDKYNLNDYMHAVPGNMVELREFLYRVNEELDEEEIEEAANTLHDILYEFSFEDKQSYQICTSRQPDSWTAKTCNSNALYLDTMKQILEEVGIDNKRCTNCDYILLRDTSWKYVNCRSCVSLMRWSDELMVYSCGRKTYNISPNSINKWRF